MLVASYPEMGFSFLL